MDKINYHYSPDTGAFTWQEPARESPAEPGTYLTPAFATPDAPPQAPDGKQAVFKAPDGTVPASYKDGAWALEVIPQPAPIPDPTPEEIAAKAWANYQATARAELEGTSKTMERIIEAVSLGTTTLGSADVVAFMTARKARRDVLSQSSGDPSKVLPELIYPQGT